MELIFVRTRERDFFHQKSASLDLRALYYMYKITLYELFASQQACAQSHRIGWFANGTVRDFCSSNLESTVTITTDGAFEVSGVDTVTR